MYILSVILSFQNYVFHNTVIIGSYFDGMYTMIDHDMKIFNSPKGYICSTINFLYNTLTLQIKGIHEVI